MDEGLRNNYNCFTNVSSDNLYHQRRTFKDSEQVFLVNSSSTETVRGYLAVQGKIMILRWM